MQRDTKTIPIPNSQKKHFVLIHGGCHGAWCWFKLKPLLEAHGHKVTTLDLAGAGVNLQKNMDLRTFRDYTAPLIEFLASCPSTEKVVLVGHSFGGLSIAVAADEYPEKVSIAVFLTACLPDTMHSSSYVLEEFFIRIPEETWMDTQFHPYGTSEESNISILFGPKCLTSKVYHLCSIQDVELAKLLIRPCSLFIENLSKAKRFTNEGYGSVEKVYIVCNEDKLIPQEFQFWMIENYGKNIIEVRELQNADHMPMLSVPNQLCQYLHEIGNLYI